MLSVHKKTEFCGKNMDMICRFYPFVYYIYFFWPVSLWVLVLLLFLGCKDL